MTNGFGTPRNFRQRTFPRYREYNTLLKVASPIPDEVLYGDPGPNGQQVDRWLAGIAFDPVALFDLDCSNPQCDTDDDFTPQDINDQANPAVFIPMEIRTGEVCSTIGLDADELRARMDARLAAQDSSMLTSALLGPDTHDGACWVNLTIEDASAQIGSTIFALDDAVARLEDYMARTLGDVLGTIFMTPGQLGLLNHGGGLVFENGCWWTPSGTAIVADGGVRGAGSSVGDDDPGPVDQFEWIYGCGPVWAHRSPVEYTPVPFADIDGDQSTHILPRNVMTFTARRHVIALFDPNMCWKIAAGYASSVFVS